MLHNSVSFFSKSKMHKFIKSVPQALFNKIIYQSASGYMKMQKPTGTLRKTLKELANRDENKMSLAEVTR